MKEKVFNQLDYEIQFKHTGKWFRSCAKSPGNNRFKTLAAMKAHARALHWAGQPYRLVKKLPYGKTKIVR